MTASHRHGTSSGSLAAHGSRVSHECQPELRTGEMAAGIFWGCPLPCSTAPTSPIRPDPPMERSSNPGPGTTSHSASASQPIERDGDDDDDSDDDVLAGVRDPGVDTAILQDRHDQTANQGAQDGPFPAVEASATDHDRGDHLEFEAAGGGRVTEGIQVDELKDA